MIDDKFDFGFAVDWMRKDLKIAMDEAKNNGSLLPITKIVDEYYSEVQAMGGKRWDTSSLIKRFRKQRCMQPAYYENFSEIKKKIWSMLDDAVTNRSSQFRIPVFVCGDQKEFDGRIVVLRNLINQMI